METRFPDSVSDCDKQLHGARIKRAELKAFGVTNSALAAIDAYIDRLLDRRTFLAQLAAIPLVGPEE